MYVKELNQNIEKEQLHFPDIEQSLASLFGIETDMYFPKI